MLLMRKDQRLTRPDISCHTFSWLSFYTERTTDLSRSNSILLTADEPLLQQHILLLETKSSNGNHAAPRWQLNTNEKTLTADREGKGSGLLHRIRIAQLLKNVKRERGTPRAGEHQWHRHRNAARDLGNDSIVYNRLAAKQEPRPSGTAGFTR